MPTYKSLYEKEREQEKITTKILQEEVGVKIRELRDNQGITLTELAIRMNNRDWQVIQRLEQEQQIARSIYYV